MSQALREGSSGDAESFGAELARSLLPKELLQRLSSCHGESLLLLTHGPLELLPVGALRVPNPDTPTGALLAEAATLRVLPGLPAARPGEAKSEPAEWILVGAPRDGCGASNGHPTECGSAYIFEEDGAGGWIERKLRSSDASPWQATLACQAQQKSSTQFEPYPAITAPQNKDSVVRPNQSEGHATTVLMVYETEKFSKECSQQENGQQPSHRIILLLPSTTVTTVSHSNPKVV